MRKKCAAGIFAAELWNGDTESWYRYLQNSADKKIQRNISNYRDIPRPIGRNTDRKNESCQDKLADIEMR